MAADHAEEYEWIYEYLNCHRYPDGFTKSQKRVLRRKSASYKIDRGILLYFHKATKLWKQVPRSDEEKERILEACHSLPEGGHMGRDKTYQKISSKFYWKCQWKDVTNFIKTCDICQRTNDAKFVKTAAPLHPIPIKPKVWRQVGVDLVGPLPVSNSGNRFIITLVDYFSKWPEAAPLPDKTAKEVALFLYKMVCRYGCTKIMITDQGREFVNRVNENLSKRLKIQHRIATAYHPQTNGLVERYRYNQTLQRCLVKFVEKEQKNWDEFIDAALFAYRTSRQKSSQFTPFELMFCRKPNLPIEMDLIVDDSDSDGVQIDEYTEQMAKLKKDLFSKAKFNIQKAQERQKKDFDRKHFQRKKLAIGMLVLLRNSAKDGRKGDKLQKQWLGPYRIRCDLGKGVFQLENPSTGIVLKKTFNSCRLKQYFAKTEAKPLKLDDSDLYQLHDESSNTSKITDDSIPPLPPPLYPGSSQMSQHKRTNHDLSSASDIIKLHSPKKRKMVFIESSSSSCQSSNTDGHLPHFIPDAKEIPSPIKRNQESKPLLKNDITRVKKNTSSDMAVKLSTSDSGHSGFACSTLENGGGYFPEFIPDANDFLPSSIEFEYVATTLTQQSHPPHPSPNTDIAASTFTNKEIGNRHFDSALSVGNVFPISSCQVVSSTSSLDIRYRSLSQPANKQNESAAARKDKIRRQKNPLTQKREDKTHLQVVDLTVDACRKKTERQSRYWIKDLCLFASDRLSLQAGHWLTDAVIDAAQSLLRRSFTEISGLQHTTLGQTLAYKIERGDFVQVLHVNNNHISQSRT